LRGPARRVHGRVDPACCAPVQLIPGRDGRRLIPPQLLLPEVQQQGAVALEDVKIRRGEPVYERGLSVSQLLSCCG
jgi:hypothetical protein